MTEPCFDVAKRRGDRVVNLKQSANSQCQCNAVRSARGGTNKQRTTVVMRVGNHQCCIPTSGKQWSLASIQKRAARGRDEERRHEYLSSQTGYHCLCNWAWSRDRQRRASGRVMAHVRGLYKANRWMSTHKGRRTADDTLTDDGHSDQ